MAIRRNEPSARCKYASMSKARAGNDDVVALVEVDVRDGDGAAGDIAAGFWQRIHEGASLLPLRNLIRFLLMPLHLRADEAPDSSVK